MISAWVIGTDQVTRRMEAMPARVQAALVRAVTAFGYKLQASIQKGKLSGQVLKVRTGNLKRSPTPRVETTADAVTGIVGTNVPYAKIHEYGGTVTVKAHVRTIKQAFGRPLKGGPREIAVPAHQVTFPERSFLRSALKDLTPSLKMSLDRAVREALR